MDKAGRPFAVGVIAPLQIEIGRHGSADHHENPRGPKPVTKATGASGDARNANPPRTSDRSPPAPAFRNAKPRSPIRCQPITARSPIQDANVGKNVIDSTSGTYSRDLGCRQRRRTKHRCMAICVASQNAYEKPLRRSSQARQSAIRSLENIDCAYDSPACQQRAARAFAQKAWTAARTSSHPLAGRESEKSASCFMVSTALRHNIRVRLAPCQVSFGVLGR